MVGVFISCDISWRAISDVVWQNSPVSESGGYCLAKLGITFAKQY
jgi:hypothetical protein